VTAVTDVVRLHLLDRRLLLGVLLVVPLFVAFGVALTAADVAAQGSLGRGFAIGIIGGLYGGLAGAQATGFSRLFAFALAMGRSRGAYAAGTLLFVLAQSLVLGGLLHLALGIEQLTGGWGADLRFMAGGWAVVDDPLGQYAVFTAPFLLTFPLVLLGCAVYARWARAGLPAAAVPAVAVVMLVLVAVGLLTLGSAPPVLRTAMLLALGLVAVAAAWGAARRAAV
jgi:hypothetical protein